MAKKRKKRLAGKCGKKRKKQIRKIIAIKKAVKKRKQQSKRKGLGMGGKKRRRGRRYHGFDGRRKRGMQHVLVMDGGGAPLGRRRGRRRGRGLLMGGLNVKEITNQAISVGAAVGGGVGALMLGKALPKTMDVRIKAAIPLVGGIAISAFMKQPILKSVGVGMAVISGLAIAQKFIPQIASLSGEGLTESEIQKILSGDPSVMGAIADMTGEAPLGAEDDLEGDDDDLSGAEDDLEGDDDDLFGAEDDLEGDDLEGENAPLAGYVTQKNL